MKTNVYITVDTETSMGGAWASPNLRPLPAERRIFCRINGRDHGIGWMCDELERRGLRATFFCEVLSNLVLGDEDTRSYLEYLLERGQDLQLHTHPNYYFYSRRSGDHAKGQQTGEPSKHVDNIGRLPVDMQRHLLSTAAEIFARFTGRRPAAYRAGGYQAGMNTMPVLSELGISLDSSYNPVFQGSGSFEGETLALNTAQELAGVWEVPVTVAREHLPGSRKWRGLKSFEIHAISLAEMRWILESCHLSGTRQVVVVAHSFSGVKASDPQYSRLRRDRIVCARFTGLLDYLSGNRERFVVSTFEELARQIPAIDSQRPESIPDLGKVRPLIRKAVQAVNHFYWV